MTPVPRVATSQITGVSGFANGPGPVAAASSFPAQVTTTASTTASTSVATDGLSGFTLGAALLVLLVAGYYLLRHRRDRTPDDADTRGGSEHPD